MHMVISRVNLTVSLILNMFVKSDMYNVKCLERYLQK